MRFSNLAAEHRCRVLLNAQSTISFSKIAKINRVNDFSLISLVVASIILALVLQQFIILSLPVIYYLFKKQIKYFARRSNDSLFERDYPIFLISLSSSIKCGLDPLTAMIQSKDLFERNTPIFKEIEKVHQQLSTGVSESEAVLDFGSELKIPDLALFKDAFLLSRQQGASLSHCLHRIARVVRTRQSFRRKTKAAIAMQKLSGVGIVIAVGVIFIIQTTTAYQTLLNAWQDPIGMKLLFLAATFVISGMVGMLRIGSSESWRT